MGRRLVAQDIEEEWDGWCGQLTAHAHDVAAGCDDAIKAARLLVEVRRAVLAIRAGRAA